MQACSLSVMGQCGRRSHLCGFLASGYRLFCFLKNKVCCSLTAECYSESPLFRSAAGNLFSVTFPLLMTEAAVDHSRMCKWRDISSFLAPDRQAKSVSGREAFGKPVRDARALRHAHTLRAGMFGYFRGCESSARGGND